jgi:Rab5 GDP/GTP exchange factor
MSPSLDSLQTLHTENSQQEPNPWSDSALTPPLVIQPLSTPSPSALEDVASRSGGIMKSDEDRAHELDSHVPADILDTFDPLAHQEEQSAREAWANAEGHPPPLPPIPSPKQDPLPGERESGTASAPAPTSTSTFPSFSSFARSFALPTLPNMNMSLVAGTTRARPQSLETATLMSTPVHPAVFSSQQDTEISARGSPKIDDPTLPPHAVQNAPRRENPSQERGAGSKDKDPPFDFQKFLDQMKSKSAEPVARYLRSCVLLQFHLLFFNHSIIITIIMFLHLQIFE